MLGRRDESIGEAGGSEPVTVFQPQKRRFTPRLARELFRSLLMQAADLMRAEALWARSGAFSEITPHAD